MSNKKQAQKNTRTNRGNRGKDQTGSDHKRHFPFVDHDAINRKLASEYERPHRRPDHASTRAKNYYSDIATASEYVEESVDDVVFFLSSVDFNRLSYEEASEVGGILKATFDFHNGYAGHRSFKRLMKGFNAHMAERKEKALAQDSENVVPFERNL